MWIKENNCVGCPPEMGCLGNSCPNRNSGYYVCDECEEDGTIYEYDGKQLCENCLLDKFEKIQD